MFKLFANIFDRLDSDKKSELPEWLIKEATERALDGTDPRMRILSGYAKTLRKPVIHAVTHVISLIDSLPPPEPVSRSDLAAHPDLAAVFYSGDRLARILSRDPAIVAYRNTEPAIVEPVSALLTVREKTKQKFGTALVDGKARRDVAQTTLSFSEHKLMDPSSSLETTDRLVKRRAFDVLLAIALLHITERQEEREHLLQRKALLRAKLDIVRRQGGFREDHAGDQREAQQRRMEEIETRLDELGPDHSVLPRNLDVVAEVLGQAERHLWLQDVSFCVDRYYVLRKPGGKVAEIPFKAIHASNEDHVLLRMVSLAPELLS